MKRRWRWTIGMILVVGAVGVALGMRPAPPSYQEFKRSTELVIKAEFETTLSLSGEELDQKDAAYRLTRRWAPAMSQALQAPDRSQLTLLKVLLGQFKDETTRGYFAHNPTFSAESRGELPEETAR